MFEFLFSISSENYFDLLGRKCYFLLSKYEKANYIDVFDDVKRWNELLEETPSYVVRFLIEQNLLRRANFEENLISLAKIDELRNFLESHSISTTGNKLSLVNKVLEIAKERDFKQYRKLKTYILTDLGIEKVKLFNTEYKNEETETIEKLTELLNTGKYLAAVKYAYNYSKGRYFEYSDIKYWNKFDKEQKNKILFFIEKIMTSFPKILADISTEKLTQIKIYTVISYLLDYKVHSNKIPCIPNNFCTDIKYDVNVCMDMLKKYAHTLQKIEESRKYKNCILHVSAGCAKPCDYYNVVFKNKSFDNKNLPEIPNPNCELPIGCQCQVYSRYL